MGHTPVHFLVLSCRTSPRLQVTYCEFLKFCKLSCEQLFLTAWSCRFPYLWPLKKIVLGKALMFQDLISFLTSGVDIFTNNPLTLQIGGYIFLLAFGDETDPSYHLVFKHIYGLDAALYLYCFPVSFLRVFWWITSWGNPGPDSQLMPWFWECGSSWKQWPSQFREVGSSPDFLIVTWHFPT